jgi:hypothetical protein
VVAGPICPRLKKQKDYWSMFLLRFEYDTEAVTIRNDPVPTNARAYPWYG